MESVETLVGRLRAIRADVMLGTDEGQHYLDCHDAADALERKQMAEDACEEANMENIQLNETIAALRAENERLKALNGHWGFIVLETQKESERLREALEKVAGGIYDAHSITIARAALSGDGE